MKTVSYTHLDVYKRQHLSESGEKGKAEGGPRFSWFATPDTPYYYSYPIDGVTYLDLGQPSVQQRCV